MLRVPTKGSCYSVEGALPEEVTNVEDASTVYLQRTASQGTDALSAQEVTNVEDATIVYLQRTASQGAAFQQVVDKLVFAQ